MSRVVRITSVANAMVCRFRKALLEMPSNTMESHAPRAWLIPERLVEGLRPTSQETR